MKAAAIEFRQVSKFYGEVGIKALPLQRLPEFGQRMG